MYLIIKPMIFVVIRFPQINLKSQNLKSREKGRLSRVKRRPRSNVSRITGILAHLNPRL